MIKKSFKIKGMHCTSCAMVIESDLEDAGMRASCSYARQTVDVEFDEKSLRTSDIQAIVKKSGYELIFEE